MRRSVPIGQGRRVSALEACARPLLDLDTAPAESVTRWGSLIWSTR